TRTRPRTRRAHRQTRPRRSGDGCGDHDRRIWREGRVRGRARRRNDIGRRGRRLPVRDRSHLEEGRCRRPRHESHRVGRGLAADPDYVRYVATTSELWVTEPDAEQIEIFRLPTGKRPGPEHAAVIAVKGGPESLVIDGKRGRAFAHLWDGATVALDLRLRSITARWANGCSGSRGIALDGERGFLFVGCAEGRAVVLDVDHDGKQLSSAATRAGVDIIEYDAARGHLYVPAAKSATLTILGVSAKGELAVLGTLPAAKGSHCATTDGNGHVFVGDPQGGRLLVIADTFPASLR